MTINTMATEQYYIAKVFKQHNSLVVVVPGVVCIGLGIVAGDHVVFMMRLKEGDMQFSKFVPAGENHGENKTGPDRRD